MVWWTPSESMVTHSVITSLISAPKAYWVCRASASLRRTPGSLSSHSTGMARLQCVQSAVGEVVEAAHAEAQHDVAGPRLRQQDAERLVAAADDAHVGDAAHAPG